MFLKSLTLKGFKSFADKTALDFEPGVTVVVGPNGSGKSNVVDSVAWVLGAQGARALRGAKMDDVIFAGTAQRPSLGRAEVSLTIDNTAGHLPIEFSEVTITRTLFRTGESEYRINGAPCRLLDIQELLSDSGIGRSQHVIVGQGRLDSVLTARPEERRAIIEEAAGILKFRKRRERAERRLATAEANVARLTDLLREVRRQLRPLERQADAARRHDGLLAELRAIRLHLAGRDLASLRTRRERLRAGHAELSASEAEVRARLRDLDARVASAEERLTGPTDDDLEEMLLRVETLRERARGLAALVAQRRKGFERELSAAADEGVVETLVADAAALRAELAGVEGDWAALAPTRAEVEDAERRVAELAASLGADDGSPADVDTEASRARRAAEAARHDAESAATRAAAALDAIVEAGRELAAEQARIDEARESLEQEAAALAPARAEAAEAQLRAAAARERFEAEFAPAGDGPAEHARCRRAEEALDEAESALRRAIAAAGRARAPAETLADALAEARSAGGARALDSVAGVVGSLVEHLEIEPGAHDAVAAALGDALHAVVVRGRGPARRAVERLRGGDERALLLVADREIPVHREAAYYPGTRPLAQVVRAADPAIAQVVERLLDGVYLVDGGWRAAVDLALANPDVVVVTARGERFGGPRPWRAGTAGPVTVTPAVLAEAEEDARRAEERCAGAERDAAAARRELDAARAARRGRDERERVARDELAARRAEADRLSRETEVRAAGLEERRAELERRASEVQERRRGQVAREASARDALAAARHAVEVASAQLDRARRDERDARARRRAGRAELDRLRAAAARLRRDFEVRGAGIEERRTVLEHRLREIEARLESRPDEQAQAQRRRADLEARREAADRIDAVLRSRASAVDALAARLHARRRALGEAARAAGRDLDGLRAQRSAAEQELAEVREKARRIEIDEAELALRIESAVESIRRDFDCEPAAALAAPVPEVPEGTTPAGRARELERELRIMGPVNPLALSEHEALLERHEFLQEQLDDVKSTRRELRRVITAVDREIVSAFEVAFADVSRHFSGLFSTLFPGGSGRLVLTEPSDLLATGVEIEARPSGKNVRRLSLLSGGERSLTALAYLFAVFRARPSPFYMLDEVEAALDDVNLHRFLDLVAEFRNEAQLLIVSHQKRTMEAADVLYGVSMPPGGSSRVVCQRMADLALDGV